MTYGYLPKSTNQALLKSAALKFALSEQYFAGRATLDEQNITHVAFKKPTFSLTMAALQLSYTEDNFNQLHNKQITLSGFLQTVMKHDGPDAASQSNKQIVMAQLVSYHNHTGAAPQIEDFEIMDASLDEKTLLGKVKIRYIIQRFYGCSDMNTAENDHETWTYQIDTNRKCLVINTPDFERLSPGDEF